MSDTDHAAKIREHVRWIRRGLGYEYDHHARGSIDHTAALDTALREARGRAERLACAFCDTLNAYDIPYEPENFCIEERDIDVRRLKRDVYGGDLPDDVGTTT